MFLARRQKRHGGSLGSARTRHTAIFDLGAVKTVKQNEGRTSELGRTVNKSVGHRQKANVRFRQNRQHRQKSSGASILAILSHFGRLRRSFAIVLQFWDPRALIWAIVIPFRRLYYRQDFTAGLHVPRWLLPFCEQEVNPTCKSEGSQTRFTKGQTKKTMLGFPRPPPPSFNYPSGPSRVRGQGRGTPLSWGFRSFRGMCNSGANSESNLLVFRCAFPRL